MSLLVYTVGLPASGKTTYAKKLLGYSNTPFKRVNRDDLRAMVDDSRWSKSNEKFIIKIQDVIILEALKSGYSVICDDTNLGKSAHSRFENLANQAGVELIREDKFLKIDVKTCIERDLQRSKSVGKDVIMKLYRQHIEKPAELLKQNTSLQHIYICDLDGTVALMNGRSPFDWKSVGEDLPNKHVVDTIRKLYQDTHVVFMSGRDEVCKPESIQWIHEHLGIHKNDIEIYMRPEGDYRKDSIIKKELYENHIKDKYYVIGVFDDRNQVVDLWRKEIGLTVFQVNYGDF